MRFIKAVYAAFKWNAALDDASRGDNVKALKKLKKISSFCEGKDFEYHLLRAKLLSLVVGDTYAVFDLETAAELLDKEDSLNHDSSEYIKEYIYCLLYTSPSPRD